VVAIVEQHRGGAGGRLGCRVGDPRWEAGYAARTGRPPLAPPRRAAPLESHAEQAGAPVAWFELWAPDLDGMLQRARELGAVVEVHRTNLPSGNAMAIIRDAGGNRLGLWAS